MAETMRPETPCVAAAMRKAARKLTLLYDTVMADTGLRITQYSILSELERWADGTAPTLTELAEILVMERSALGQTLKPLLRDGLVDMTEDPADRRRRAITLTSRGKRIFAKARPRWDIAQQLFRDSFGDGESVALRATLLRIAKDPRLSYRAAE
jgi:DNA-binding MarR family transcriptional regulator